MVWSPFKRKEEEPRTGGGSIELAWDASGLSFAMNPARDGWLFDGEALSGMHGERALLLGQLVDEGFARWSGSVAHLAWDDFFKLSTSPEHAGGLSLLGAPPIEDWKPALSSRGTLTDADFNVLISSWTDPEGSSPRGNVVITGAVIAAGQRRSVLPEATWQTVRAVAQLRELPGGERDADSIRRAWSKIRRHAQEAGADLADFLRKTVVLTPERLRMDMRKADAGGATVVELSPTFEGAPPRWMEFFDRQGDVPERYDIPDGQGITHVMLSPEVRTVLREVRRMPGRRIAGDRAEAFIRNPFAALGPDAASVIDPVEFERSREDAGIAFARFTARVWRDARGYPYECSLLVEEALQGQVRSDLVRFDGAHGVKSFLARLEARMQSGAQCCHWEGYDLEILGDTPDQALLLREALADLTSKGVYAASDIFDLSKYSDRIEGFGVEKPYYSPFIAKKSDDAGWFPENVDFGLCYTPEGGGETIAIVLDDQSIDGFREEVRKAQEEKRETFVFPGCPKPVPVEWAAEALETLGKAREDVGKGAFEPKKPGGSGKEAVERKGLVVKANVDSLDYEERRGSLAPTGEPPRLPTSLHKEIELKEHQLVGVAWLQHLWRLSPSACRGALLADDMGLGKTIQLLTFIAAALEYDGDIDPFLIVAPVSLLENWKEEIAKFFKPGTMDVLTLYGPALAQKRVAKKDLEEDLLSAGATRLLSPGWLGNAQVVLTTYETLRDLEFSLAAQRWSAMICDEAQKIKNPNALVTRAAKKQNARMRIACTGTPVENTLTDIWCLFDFVQPGLLGALKDFGERYRKPIEAETEEEKARIEELRAIIEPQKLRRTKAEVAKDLPRKIEVESCRALSISTRQRVHYADAVAAFKKRGKGVGTGLQSPLGLLQYLRRLCSDPRPPGSVSTDTESIMDIESRSPKMSWLLKQLVEIKGKGEKAIVFCEFRDLQRTLQRAIGERFDFVPDVINGDTSADSANANNRQRRIKAFQEKPGFGVIVLSPLAVGFGVNIQAANHVVHFTRTWNPAKEDQATDRAYRIGQTRDVYVYYPVVVAHDFLTFDAKLDALLNWKRGLSTDMLNGAGDVSPADFGDLESPDGGNAFGNELLGPDDIGSMDADSFEAFCALLWSKQGYSRTMRTPRAGDGGVDVIAIRGKNGVVIQCKSSSIQGREHGWEAVKDVSAGVAAYAARYQGVSFRMVAATNQRFNGTARSQAATLHVELIEGDGLAKLLGNHPVKRGELERFLLAGWNSV